MLGKNNGETLVTFEPSGGPGHFGKTIVSKRIAASTNDFKTLPTSVEPKSPPFKQFCVQIRNSPDCSQVKFDSGVCAHGIMGNGTINAERDIQNQHMRLVQGRDLTPTDLLDRPAAVQT